MAVAARAEDPARMTAAQPEDGPELGGVLEVVGGRDTGGIKVREGRDTASAEAPARLAFGALIRAEEVDGLRVRYSLLRGEGPESGWATLRVGGKALLAPVAGAAQLYIARLASAAKEAAAAEAAAAEAAQLRGGRGAFGARKAFPLWGSGAGRSAQAVPADKAKAALEKDIAQQVRPKWERSQVDDKVVMCRQCKLPVGQVAYAAGGKSKAIMHGECTAQHMLQEMREEEQARKDREAELKAARRADYEIGWRGEAAIPAPAAARLQDGASAPQGMCCLAVEGSGLAVRIAPTLEPGAAVNLEYLSVLLRVRRQEGREPLFSLDPVDPTRPRGDAEASMQAKRFEPEWIAGTSVGEVMFQADYHLKELSMGEYDQPVIGMRSCFELSREEGCEEDWSAREWFVVRKAEIHLSEDDVLVPFLKLGVEAREQVLGPHGLDDAPLTRYDHPLVRYAEDFSRNFDLIAERKSVVHELRELAKASALAKFLLESGTQVGEAWFHMAEGSEVPCCLEVPQLWHDRYYSEVQVQGGEVLDADRAQRGDLSRRHGVYGGIDFGIDRFRLAAPSRVAAGMSVGRVALGAPASALMATSQQRLTLEVPRAFSRLAGPLAAPLSLAPSRVAAMGVPQRLAAPVSGMSVAAGLRAPSGVMSASAVLRAPQGVDLSLEQFNLSEPTMAGGKVRAPDGDLVIGSSFWPALQAPSEEAALLRRIFNPFLSDRRSDGERFQPPPTGAAYVQKLRELVEAEEDVRQARRDHFLSTAFLEESAGPLFPASWTSSFQGQASNPHRGLLEARPDLSGDSAALREAIASAAPAFDRTAEDGARFRIYRFGTLEVRTTQEHEGEEEVGAIFSARSSMQAWGAQHRQQARDFEPVVRATELIEAAPAAVGGRRCYVVLETEAGHSIVTEKLPDGMATWQEDPKDLEDRNSLAKVLRSADCGHAGVLVRDLKAFQMRETRAFGLGVASPDACEQYSQIVYSRASGQAHGFTSGYLLKTQLHQAPMRRSGKGSGKGRPQRPRAAEPEPQN